MASDDSADESRRDVHVDQLSTEDEYLVTIDGRDGEREYQDVWSMWEMEEMMKELSKNGTSNPNKGRSYRRG